MLSNIFEAIPKHLIDEDFKVLLVHEQIKIERIVSMGHQSPDKGWYDQQQNEWVMVLRGEARLCFADQGTTDLKPGDFINIPAHTKHKVTWTTPDEETVWLAVHY